jgi:hypothetical protein
MDLPSHPRPPRRFAQRQPRPAHHQNTGRHQPWPQRLAQHEVALRHAVFDGRRRFALEIGKRQRESTRIHCDAEYVRLAGFKPKWMGKNATRPFTLFLEQRTDGLFEVIRAVGDTSFGPIVLLLRD